MFVWESCEGEVEVEDEELGLRKSDCPMWSSKRAVFSCSQANRALSSWLQSLLLLEFRRRLRSESRFYITLQVAVS